MNSPEVWRLGMTVKMRLNLAIPITAVLGVTITFLLRVILTTQSGFTVTTPKATYYIGGSVVYFWVVLGVTAIVCLVLWRRAR